MKTSITIYFLNIFYLNKLLIKCSRLIFKQKSAICQQNVMNNVTIKVKRSSFNNNLFTKIKQQYIFLLQKYIYSYSICYIGSSSYIDVNLKMKLKYVILLSSQTKMADNMATNMYMFWLVVVKIIIQKYILFSTNISTRLAKWVLIRLNYLCVLCPELTF